MDIVEVRRVAEAIERHGERFLRRVFTEAERAYCTSRGVPEQHFAGRFAAKEAVLKALGTGWGRGVHWHDIEVRQTASGSPVAELKGGAARVAASVGITRMHISISHTGSHAVGLAVAEGAE